MEFLKQDLELKNDFSYTFISDKQKGLLDAVKDLLPNAEHRHCARHMYNNFKGDGHIGIELIDLFGLQQGQQPRHGILRIWTTYVKNHQVLGTG